jgi:predicted CXXCH cytochrome family protein
MVTCTTRMPAPRAMAIVAVLLAPAAALPFHDGGAGACEGCHAMHTRPTGQSPSPWLLLASDQSSVCLNCHGGPTPGGYQVLSTDASTFQPGAPPPGNFTPGGDFAWLNRTYTWLEAGNKFARSAGASHGHNVTAADYLLDADPVFATAPGGTYPSSQLSCISCHDPHGRFRVDDAGTTRTTGAPITASGSYGGPAFVTPSVGRAVGAYRLLGGVGYAPRSGGPTLPQFTSGPPIALAPIVYNQSERTTEVRVAYGAGMSEWCRNCHGLLHTPSAANATTPFQHPAGSDARLNAGSALAIYNSYIRSGVLTGIAATAYLSLVPYEEGTAVRQSLAPHAVSDGTVTMGPTTGLETVMCLSCHRAHASGWDHGLRWNGSTGSGLILVDGAWPGSDAPGRVRAGQDAGGHAGRDVRP